MTKEPRFNSPRAVVTAAIAPALASLSAIYADAVAADNSALRYQTLLARAKLRGCVNAGGGA